MPKLTKDLPVTIAFRATEVDARKLAALAELTHRGQGEVLRLLLRHAMVAQEPDIQLAGISHRVQEAGCVRVDDHGQG